MVIINVDIASSPAPLPTNIDSGGALVIFWWRGQIALGQRQLAADQLPLTAPALRTLAEQATKPALAHYQIAFTDLAQRGDELLRPIASQDGQSAAASVSVIVPTCGRPQQLAACLRSLAALRQAPLEILVIDNAPPPENVCQRVQAYANVRYIKVPQPGASRARNTGAAQARGEIIAFVDDDETVHPDWLAWLGHGFRDPDTAAVTGLVLPATLDSEAQRLFEQRFSFVRGYRPQTFDHAYYRQHRARGVPVWDLGGSGNLAIRKSVFERLGGFDERLGAGPEAAGCSEDSELFYNLLAHGLSCRYEPRAVTYHAHRQELRALRQQLYFYMRGHVAALLIQYAKYRDSGNLVRLLVILPAVYARYALRALLTKDPGYRFTLLFNEIKGCLSGVLFYFRHRHNSPVLSRKLP